MYVRFFNRLWGLGRLNLSKIEKSKFSSIFSSSYFLAFHSRERHFRGCLNWFGFYFGNSKFEIILSQKIRKTLSRHLLWKASIIWKPYLESCQHSDLYNSTDLTILLQIRNFARDRASKVALKHINFVYCALIYSYARLAVCHTAKNSHGIDRSSHSRIERRSVKTTKEKSSR